MAGNTTPIEDEVMDNYALTKELKRLKRAYATQTTAWVKEYSTLAKYINHKKVKYNGMWQKYHINLKQTLEQPLLTIRL